MWLMNTNMQLNQTKMQEEPILVVDRIDDVLLHQLQKYITTNKQPTSYQVNEYCKRALKQGSFTCIVYACEHGFPQSSLTEVDY